MQILIISHRNYHNYYNCQRRIVSTTHEQSNNNNNHYNNNCVNVAVTSKTSVQFHTESRIDEHQPDKPTLKITPSHVVTKASI